MPPLAEAFISACALMSPILLIIGALQWRRFNVELDRCDRREREMMDRNQRLHEVNNAMAAHSFEYQQKLETFEAEIAALRKGVVTMIKGMGSR